MKMKNLWLLIAIAALAGFVTIACNNGTPTPCTTHNFDNWLETTAPTCTAAGEETGTCTVDKCNETTTRPVNALGHDFIDGICTECYSIEMVWIPAGTFTMGSPDSIQEDLSSLGLWGSWFNNELPSREVTMSGFWMGKYQVTQALYEAVMNVTQSWFTGENRPVENVSWYDVIVFCNRLSIREGLDPAYSIEGSTDPEEWIENNGGNIPTGNNATWNSVEIVSGSTGYRLPTEAQWEYACRGETDTYWHFGDDVGDMAEYAWYGKSSSIGTQEVGQLESNNFGLYDMLGNVWEWCWDWYSEEYYSESGNKDDPMGPGYGSHGDRRVVRGGAWLSVEMDVRSASRHYDFFDSGGRVYYIGFRYVRP